MAYPTVPSAPTSAKITFPRDLVADNRKYFIQIEFVDYNYSLVSNTKYTPPKGGVILPIPKKINDIQTVVWEAESFLAAGASLAYSLPNRLTGFIQAAGAAKGVAEGVSGFAVNPFLWMLFKSPDFKEYIFSWTLTANNYEESLDIANIINYFKREMSPSKAASYTFSFNNPLLDNQNVTVGSNLLYKYPSIALIKLFPDDDFTMTFKPAAVLAVNADYTGGGTPSFYESGAPTVVNLTVLFKEIQLWTKEDFVEGASAKLKRI